LFEVYQINNLEEPFYRICKLYKIICSKIITRYLNYLESVEDDNIDEMMGCKILNQLPSTISEFLQNKTFKKFNLERRDLVLTCKDKITAMTSNGTYLAVSDNNSVYLIRAYDGTIKHIFDVSNKKHSFSFSPDTK